MAEEYLHFTVDSGLLKELGEKLVETVHLALVELVKNAYDADASKVELFFSKDSKGHQQIVISDNGTGMNFKAVKEYWMRIATTNKVGRKISSVYGRPLTGAKGIGRFSCRRLGGHLKLITKGTKKGNVVGMQSILEKTIVDFPWTEFAAGEDVTDIKCFGSQTEIKNEATGTTLIISDMPEEWTVGGYNWLKRQLAVLTANRGKMRKGFIEDTGFNVQIIAPNFDETVRDIRADFINAGWGTLTAKIDENGHAECKLQAKDLGTRTKISSGTFPLLKDVVLHVGIFVDDKTQFRDKKMLSMGTLEKILPEWGGVQVKHKGVRVYPYGDDDWLGIDYDRGLRTGKPIDELFVFAQSLKGVDAGRSLLTMLSMRSYVGNVEIGEKAQGFEPKLNREGFVSSAAVDQLREFVRFSIDWTTILHDYYLREKGLREAISAKENFEEVVGQKIEQGKVVEAAISHLASEAKTLSEVLPVTQRKEFTKVFESVTDVIRKQNTANQNELTHLRLIASTSTLLLIFSHEVKSLLGVLEQSKNALSTIVEELTPKQRKVVEKVSSDFTDLKDRLAELLGLTSLVGTGYRKAKPGQIAILERIKKVEKVFELITKKYDIQIDYRGVPNNTVLTNILESEVYSILLNVFSNAIKSVIAGGNIRKIQLVAERSNGQNVLTIRDTGLGLDASRFEEVFAPFISDPDGKLYRNLDKRLNPEDDLIIGSGSGLGLGIVKEIVIAHNGSIRFKTPSKSWSAELEIKLP